ncbi:MAG: FGGY-family carbohydrate kinase [Treponema sp.]|nr:FGGY-family carbohydrate kinase [Treponema sp.]
MDIKQAVLEGKTILGVEFGSTRVKSVLINEDFSPIAAGSHDWENRLEDGIWTYHLDDVWTAVQNSYRSLAQNVKTQYGIDITSAGAIGISAMMHGYLAFDKNGNQLAQFRTWRNTATEKAAAALTEKFQFNIPLRWSIAHLYQVMLNNEPHAKDIDFITTLAGYIHWKLTGLKVLGIGDASGMFPIDSSAKNYDSAMLEKFSQLEAPYGFTWKIKNILPKVLNAGEDAGLLTEEGAKLLDPNGSLKPGIPLCPPEGDAGTGMVATNSITERTGNISAGTSVFAMIVLEKDLSKVYPEIDIVATPAGKSVAMVHCNNCTSDIDAWVRLFTEIAEIAGVKMDKTALYSALYNKALEADTDCGGLLAYNYFSGEPLTGIEQGRPLFARLPDSNFSLANFMRTLIFSAFAALKYGMDILTEKENVKIDSLLGHGGFFKIKGVAQRLMAAAFNTPVSVMEETSNSSLAAEGGAWGIALLAAFRLSKVNNNSQIDLSLEKYLMEKVFAGLASLKINPDKNDAESFKIFMERYTAGLEIEKTAAERLQ